MSSLTVALAKGLPIDRRIDTAIEWLGDPASTQGVIASGDRDKFSNIRTFFDRAAGSLSNLSSDASEQKLDGRARVSLSIAQDLLLENAAFMSGASMVAGWNKPGALDGISAEVRNRHEKAIEWLQAANSVIRNRP